MYTTSRSTVLLLLGMALPALLGGTCLDYYFWGRCPDLKYENWAELRLADSWDDIAGDGRYVYEPARWATSGEEVVVVAESPPWCHPGYPSPMALSSVVVRAQSLGDVATGSLTIVATVELPLGEFRVVGLEQDDGRLEIRAERMDETRADLFGNVALLVVQGASSDNYENLTEEAERILGNYESGQGSSKGSGD